MQKWTDNIKTIQDENFKLGIVATDIQYAGFGPETVNIFRNMRDSEKPNGREGRRTPRTTVSCS
jgi:hypothetical protein